MIVPNPGDHDDELIEKLEHIDQWLNSISHVSEQPTQRPGQRSTPQHPGQRPAQQRPAQPQQRSFQQRPNRHRGNRPFPQKPNLPQRPNPARPAGTQIYPGSRPSGIQSLPAPQNRPHFHGKTQPKPVAPFKQKHLPAQTGSYLQKQSNNSMNFRKNNQKNRRFSNRNNVVQTYGKPAQSAPSQKPKSFTFSKDVLRIIPLGGFEEIGKNMMAFEYEHDIVIVDMGLQFPTEDMLGVDYVLPDATYLIERKHLIRGVFLTHGHLDHIGGIPYILPKLGFPPVYGTPFTLGLVKKHLTEFGFLKQSKLITFKATDHFRVGVFDVSFFPVAHSIPDSVGIVLDTPCGRVVHTGDFKFDFTPSGQPPSNLQTISQIGDKGVVALISDSTNALEPGFTTTEKVIAENLEKIIEETTDRLIITSFSSLIGRLQNIIDSALKLDRKIFLTGRSIENNIAIAKQLGYIKLPDGLIQDVRKMNKYDDKHVLILTTGSQGEDMSALARMASNRHAHVKIKKGDTVVVSASPIIGNEIAIFKVINGLCRLGAKIITNKDLGIHTSGHGKQEDLKLMIRLMKPRYLIPEHGDFYMRTAHKELGMQSSIQEENILILDNGVVTEVRKNGEAVKTKEKVPAGYVMVEGPERSEVASHILMDRQLMAENGAVVVLFPVHPRSFKLKGRPMVESRGFVYFDLKNKVEDEIKKTGERAFVQFLKANPHKIHEDALLVYLAQTIDRALVKMLDKKPLVLPVLVEV